MRRLLVVGLAAVVGVAAGSVPALGGEATIGTEGNSFTPATVTVDVGSTVTVTNSNGGSAPHNLIWEDGAPGIASPSTATWSSARAFSAVGDFRFYCSVHGDTGGVGMAGLVRVQQPPPPPGTPPPEGASPPPAVTPTPAPAPGTPESPVGAPGADTTAPKLTRLAVSATRRALTLRLTLSEPSRVTVVVQRNRRTVARQVFRDRRAGRTTLRLVRRSRPGKLTVRVTAVDVAGNTTRRAREVRVGR
jgi:plastocyanin